MLKTIKNNLLKHATDLIYRSICHNSSFLIIFVVEENDHGLLWSTE